MARTPCSTWCPGRPIIVGACGTNSLRDHPAMESIRIVYPGVDYHAVDLEACFVAWATISTLHSLQLSESELPGIIMENRHFCLGAGGPADGIAGLLCQSALETFWLTNCDIGRNIFRAIICGLRKGVTSSSSSKLKTLHLVHCMYPGNDHDIGAAPELIQELDAALQEPPESLKDVQISLLLSPFSQNYCAEEDRIVYRAKANDHGKGWALEPSNR